MQQIGFKQVNRWKHYSRYLNSLDTHDSTVQDAPLLILELSSFGDGKPLLPSLKTLRVRPNWTGVVRGASALMHILGPSLKNLHLEFDKMPLPEWVDTYLGAVVKKCIGLARLSIRYSGVPEISYILNDSAHHIAELTSLTTLSLPHVGLR